MADISSYLAAIMAAVYGEDVRGSIHDAIEIINDVSEVVLNTGTAVTGPTSSSTGFYKDSFYINTNTMELWKCIGTDAWQSQGILKGADGADGNGIVSIAKTATVGLVDTYTITYDDGNTETYTVTNGQNGSKWYKGTAISGTGTSITGFPGVINDFYLNSSTGYVYTCTKTGGSLLPDAAEWDYVMALTGGGGSSVTVIDNLTSTSSTDALSANQGRVLKGLVDSKADASSVPSDLDDLSDVSIDTQTLDDGQILAYNLADDEFQNVSPDASPTQNSVKPVQSGGVYTALSGKADTSALDEWTTGVQTLDGTTFVFDNLSDSYGYDLYGDDKLYGISSLSKTTGTNTGTIKLTYTVSGASIGDYGYLRILK